MERLEGVPLSFRADEGKILPDQVIAILLQVCDALIAAHAANVIHRDLKLDNIFLIDNPDDPKHPKVKLLDWGIAKIISTDVRVTIEGQLVGTPQYLSPEQARGAAVSPATDVYSLGVMAYEMFLEQLPFEAETSAEIMAMHLRATPPPPSEMWPDIPPKLENLLLAMLAKDPEARPTVLTVAHTLETIRGDLERRRHDSGINDGAPARAATIIPERRSASRWAVPQGAGLAPTERADEWMQPTHRRWHVVVGTLAIAASALMFLFTRETEKAEASAARSAVVDQVSLPDVRGSVRGTEPDTVSPAALATADAPASLDNLTVSAPAALAGVAAQPVTPNVTKSAKRAPRTGVRRVQVKPRLESTLDPDGTLDPYR
jgi:serine/threonine-protein kinase